MPDDYYTDLAAEYAGKRDHIVASLEGAGLKCSIPRGAYYVMADISQTGFQDDLTFVRHLIEKIGIAAVPGSSFFLHPADGARFVRFCFCKKYATLETAREKLNRLNV
jgi:aspartate/methionine/tyrosine aminotransferase